MKFIVPAKTNSTRVKDKNWREFSGGRSLVRICVEKLLPLGEVWVTCEDAFKAREVESWGAEFHLRPLEWTRNEYPLTDWIRNTCSQIAPGETVGWCQVTSPLFNEYGEMVADWGAGPEDNLQCDSMVAVYPDRGYRLDEHMRPSGWGWGPWHTTGQALPMAYQMPWVFSILTPESIRATGYHIGAKPAWYVADCPSVDIDTEADWRYAKWLYENQSVNC